MSDEHDDPLAQVERVSLTVRAQRLASNATTRFAGDEPRFINGKLDGELNAFTAGMRACVLANVDDDDENPEALELADAILDAFDTPDYSIYRPEQNVVV